MRHDPERTAAAYLAGELAPRQRERFEAHVLGCDDCWREVTAGRQGRALAESLREVAPQHLRERIRATIAAAPAPPRRRIRLGTRMPALLGVVAALLAAAVAGGPPPARQLDGLTWQGATRGELAGLPVVAHTYQDVAGHRLVLLVAGQPFPQAVGARHASSGATWTARVDGAVLYCADQPAPSLLVGADRAEVLAAAQRLGLR